ncbi:MAG: hypothetical protein ACYDAD_04030 [Acidimicrobiales bacterium]
MSGRLGHRLLGLASLVLVAVATASCQASLQANIQSHANGSGLVTVGLRLDDDALAQVGRAEDLASALRVDDLRRAGWTVVGPRREKDGGTWVRAAHGFTRASDATKVLGQIDGPDGPFRDLRLERHRSWWWRRLRFSGTIDASRDVVARLADPQLLARLTASDAQAPGGPSTAALLGQAEAAARQGLRFEVSARLPGSISSNAAHRGADGLTWDARPGDSVVHLRATASAWDLRRIALAGLVLVLALAAVGLFIRARLAPARRRAARWK